MPLTQLQKSILDHYRAHWGEPKEILAVARPLVPSYICRFDLEAKLFVYSTLGMSEKRQVVQDKQGQKRTIKSEIFMYAATINPELVELLAMLVEYPFVHRTFFAWGHTILGTEPVTKAARMTDLLVLPPLNESKSLYAFHSDQEHTDILWVMPIYRAETIFLRTNPWRNLLNLLIDAEVDAADLWRPAVIA